MHTGRKGRYTARISLLMKRSDLGRVRFEAVLRSVHRFVRLVMDTLIAEGRIPPIVAVFVDSGGDDSVGSQRGLEYDTVSGLFASFLETEVLPHVESEVGIKLTRDPEGRAVLGGSSGGACALSCAWFRPDLFRRVLCYSGTFVNQQSPFNPEYPAGAWEYHSGLNLVGTSVKKPLKICLCECPRSPLPTRLASLCSPRNFRQTTRSSTTATRRRTSPTTTG